MFRLHGSVRLDCLEDLRRLMRDKKMHLIYRRFFREKTSLTLQKTNLPLDNLYRLRINEFCFTPTFYTKNV